MNERDTPGPIETYDIYMHLACQTVPVLPEEYGPAPSQVMAQPPGTLYVGLPLADARRYLKALKDAGGLGTLAPVRYRHPGISAAEGLAQAHEEFERQREPGEESQAYGPIELIRDEGVWWLYRARRQTPWVGEPRAPGHAYFYVDKLDGHLLTPKDVEEWTKLSIVT